MTTEKLYRNTPDHIDLGQFYTKHVSAMTREALHSKAEIAAELAVRDREIAILKSRLAAALHKLMGEDDETLQN